jgi:phosphoribosylamine---glycine ligase
MSRFLLLSEVGDGLGLALRLMAEGHDVKLWLRDKKELGLGRGLVDEAKRYERSVIADCTGFGVLLDALRESEFQVFGGGEFADRLEEDRAFAEEIMQEAGIQTPDSQRVTSFEEAEEFIRTHERVVLKPEGGLSGVHPSEVAQDKEDALDILESLKKEYPDGNIQLELQQFLPGIAVSTEGWFNGRDWIPTMFNHTLERKQKLAGDLGDSTGCVGNLVWACGRDVLVRETLLKLTEVLQEHLYVGPLDVNCIVNEEGIYGLEFTPRFGYDAMPTLVYSLCEFDFGDFIDSTARGNIPTVRLRSGFGAGIRLSVPEGDNAAVKIRGLDLEDLQYFYPYCVAYEDFQIKSTGKSGVLGVMNGFGDTPDEAFADAYLRVEKVKAKKLQYRNDLLEVLTDEYNKLRQLLTESDSGWIGFDLDGTLANYSEWSEEIGEPFPEIVERAKLHVSSGDWVKILTARGSVQPGKYEQLLKIHAWVKNHIGAPLQVTDRKDPGMKVLYDDRVIRVDEDKLYDDIPVRN